MMSPQDRAFTHAWWTQVCADEPRLIRFLQKLRETEFSGYQDNRDAAAKWARRDEHAAARHIFLKTGDDELRHSDLLVNVLRGRGVWPTLVEPPPSLYWNEMDVHIVSLESCAAVFHLGEQLAADRFEIMLAHPDTPSDVVGFLKSALPDELHHARIFARLSNAMSLVHMREVHDGVVAQLKKASQS